MMPEPVQNSPESLDAVLAALLEMSEQGQAADRKAWMSRYPQFAAELEEFFTSREHLEPWASQHPAALGGPRPRADAPAGREPDSRRTAGWSSPCCP